ncbi:2'-5' RNA ligase [bacterium]|nr:MAG: 2'-5' RNA ligase [bacterium]
MNVTEPSVKYPRTLHLPWSDTIGDDGDHVLESLHGFLGQEVVVTEKLDGENTTLYRTHLHARSLDSGHHPSRGWIKNFHARLAPHISSGIRINGESMFALHSIFYESLPSYFLVFGIWRGDVLLGWDETAQLCAELEELSGEILPVVPVLYRGVWNEKTVRALYPRESQFGPTSEGYVVRLAHAIPRDEWNRSIAKYVRPRHVQTGPHWMLKPVEKNGLRPSEMA